MRRASLIGAHVSVVGGLVRSLARARDVGAEVIQIFVANPRGWAQPVRDQAAEQAFAAACADAGMPVFVHAPYLINFGSPSQATVTQSAAALQFSLQRASAIGARAVVMHAGSALPGGDRAAALGRLRQHLLGVLDGQSGPRLLIEPTAGGGGALASDATSLASYLDALDRDERVGVCLDTCHMHAAGHDMSGVAAFTTALRTFARASRPNTIDLIHVNDSRDPVGSLRDRHASIGAGTIGATAFGALFTAPASRSVPLVVESPPAQHAADIAALDVLRTQIRS